MELFDLEYGVMVACDVDSIDVFKKIITETCSIEGIVGYKIGFSLALKYGLASLTSVVKEKSDLPVIYDHQKAGTDIPQMGEKFAETCFNGGVKGVILFPQAGPRTEKAFIEGVFIKGMIPLVGGEMTHPGYLVGDQGYIRDDAPIDIYTLAADMKVKYYIIPGNKPQITQKYHDLLSGLGVEAKYCMPGIGRQGGDIKSSFASLSGSSAYAIIGSGIYRQANMGEAAKQYCKEALSFG